MKFSESWLREWVNPPLTTLQLADQLTMAGLEVEALERAGVAVTGVVVAEVRSVEQHPDADRLRVCQVFDGEAIVQVVCGAPNVRAGMRAVFAREGAELPGLRIKRSKLRGVESCGMLCSADELGLEAESAGLLELPSDSIPGHDVNVLLNLGEQVIELGLTPNRGDCLGMAGLAREVAALNAMDDYAPRQQQPIPATITDALDISLAAPEACPRYAGRVIHGVDLNQKAPLWLRERLRRAGVRSIDPVVDVTNYVMLELGQPMHAFDLRRLGGHICVRWAAPGEKLVLLDGSELALNTDSLVIADNDGAVALAGIMGGKHSAVSAQTRDIFLESAFFAPAAMAGKARAFGMHTDASHRFERGVDFDLQVIALERATQLLLDIVGGEPGPVVLATAAEHLPRLPAIKLREQRLDTMLGVTVPAGQIEAMLRRLGMQPERDGAGWLMQPPSYRYDLRIEADLMEEVARLHGYARIPSRVQSTVIPLRARSETRRSMGEMRERLMALGYQEVITYSFVEPALQALLDPGLAPVAVTNPISADMAVMRTTLWAGLLKAAQFNQNRQQRSLRLFETGLRFLPGAEGLQQRMSIAGLACGERAGESWANAAAALDFFDIKGDIETLLGIESASARYRFEPAAQAALHPGQSALLSRDGEALGLLGALHPELLRTLDLQGPVFLFELDFDLCCKKNLPSFKGLSKFPEVRRDLAIVLDEAVPAETVLQAVREAAGEWLVNLNLFDVYRGQGIEKEKKSVALGMVLQHRERTLTDEDVSTIIDRVVASLSEHCGATLR
jgi:phenylalanyl-tRNA synthetase beta chain